MWFVIIALIFFIIYPYVLYPLILYVIKKEDTPAEETEGSLSVSLYIAAYNEEGIIGENWIIRSVLKPVIFLLKL